MSVIPGNVTIANGASLSDALDVDGMLVTAIVLPATWTAAAVTFQGSAQPKDYSREQNGPVPVFNDLYDSAGEISLASITVAAASRHIDLDPNKFAGLRQIKVRSGTSGAPVNQAAARTVTVVARAN